MISRDGERHQLLERHAVVGIHVEEFWGNRRKPEPLLHDTDGYEEDGRDFLLGFPLLPQGLECSKLVERMKRDTMHVFGKRVLFRRNLTAGISDDAGDRRGLRETLLLDQEPGRAIAATSPAGTSNMPVSCPSAWRMGT